MTEVNFEQVKVKSNKGKRTNNNPVIFLLRTYFFTFGKLFPGITGQQALSLFSTPIRRPQKTLKPPLDSLIKQANKTEIIISGKEVCVYKWGNESKKKILLVHGWDSMAIDFSEIISSLLSYNYEIYSFDAPAHGFSKGKQTNILEFKKCITEILQNNKSIEYIVAHSIGGSASVLSLRNDIKEFKFKKLILIAPPANLNALLENFISLLKLPKSVEERLRAGIHTRLNSSLSKLSLIELPKPENIEKLLFIHDQFDDVISYEESLHMSKIWKDCLLETTQNLNHYKMLRNPEVINKIIEFIEH